VSAVRLEWAIVVKVGLVQRQARYEHQLALSRVAENLWRRAWLGFVRPEPELSQRYG
jgi:hypothetical protein